VNIIVSCHYDTVFKDPFACFEDGILKGACDNIAGVLAMGHLMHEAPGLHYELTEDEEVGMDGARSLAKAYSSDDTLFIVIDVTERAKRWKSILFTIENFHRIQPKHIKTALKSFYGKYRLRPTGTESEAWLYRDKGFATVEIDIPVAGGLHNLKGVVRGEDMWAVAEATRLLAEYFAPKNIREIEGEID